MDSSNSNDVEDMDSSNSKDCPCFEVDEVGEATTSRDEDTLVDDDEDDDDDDDDDDEWLDDASTPSRVNDKACPGDEEEEGAAEGAQTPEIGLVWRWWWCFPVAPGLLLPR